MVWEGPRNRGLLDKAQPNGSGVVGDGLGLAITCYVALGKSLPFSEPQFLILSNEKGGCQIDSLGSFQVR